MVRTVWLVSVTLCSLVAACGGGTDELSGQAPVTTLDMTSSASPSADSAATAAARVGSANTVMPPASMPAAGRGPAAGPGQSAVAGQAPIPGQAAVPGQAAAPGVTAGPPAAAAASAGSNGAVAGGISMAMAGVAGAAGTAAQAGPTATNDMMQTPPPAAAPGPLFPANGATNVCADATLHLRFDAKPTLGSGRISVFEKGNSTTPVASVDVSAGQTSVSPGGTQLTFLQPVFVVDKEVIVQLPAALAYGKSYYVTVDSGAVRGSGGAMPLGGENDWHFTTRAAPPANPSQLRIALDGTGDFCSVQGGLEAAAAGAMVTLGRGYYHELVHVSGKSGVTLKGDDRKATVILGVNNDNLNSGTAKRALVNIEKSTDLTIQTLTIQNLTKQDGSQAEALRLQGCDKCVVRDADIISLQDTLLWSGRIYAKDCYIAGNVDFVWGTGAVYFDKCEIKTLGRKGFVVQSRNDPGESGYVFVDSKITADPGVTGIMLGRIDVSVYPGSQVAYVNCQMGRYIAPEGWTITGGVAGSSLRFWEYQSKDESGGMLDVSRRHASSQQISAEQAAMLRDPSKVLGGWMPQ